MTPTTAPTTVPAQRRPGPESGAPAPITAAELADIRDQVRRQAAEIDRLREENFRLRAELIGDRVALDLLAEARRKPLHDDTLEG